MDGYNAAAWLLDRRIDAGDDERVAVRCDGESVTYDELRHQVWRAQHALDELGVRAGDRVALVLDDELAFPAWYLGAMRSGIVPVPLSTMLTADDLGAIVHDAGATALVVSAPYRPYVTNIASNAPDLRHAVEIDGGGTAGSSDGGGVQADTGDVPVHRWSEFGAVDAHDIAAMTGDSPGFWLYSSGTTGTPKGVMHRHGNLQATADTYGRQVLEIGPDDRCLSVAKLFFAFGLGNSLTFPMSVGACSILDRRRPTPAGVIETIEAERPTLFFASPGFIAALLDADPPPAALASIRCTVTAGEALPADLQRRFSTTFGHPVLDGIGSTEVLHIFLSNAKGAERPGSSGTPVPGYEMMLLDDDGNDITDADTPGYLHVKGPSISTGYWQRADATAAAFRGEWLRTGDVYTRSADGYWTFLGRNNDMIKAGGIWVSPAEVESVLIEHADVLEAAVVGDHNRAGLEEVVAFVVPRSGHRVDVAELEAHCRSRMAAFKRPRRMLVVDELPKTATGKVQRFALRESLAR